MIFGEPPKNAKEIMAALDRLARRKGKPVEVSELRDGDIFRGKDNRYSLRLVEIEPERNGDPLPGPDLTIWSASTLYSARLAIGSVGKLSDYTDADFEGYVVIGHKGDYPEPQHVPQIKTFYHVNLDGSVCGQNLIYGVHGQHFRVSPEKWAELAADPEREWIAERGPCPDCQLALGQCQEYDGHLWQMES